MDVLVRGSLEVAVKLRRRPGDAEAGANERSTDAALVVQDLTYAGLEALRAVAPLDLCAYLHLSDGQGPQLFLASPTLASIDPTTALNLFTALRDALDSGHDEHDSVALGGYLAITITTKGAVSRGLHVVGRKTQTFSDDERRALRDLAERFGAVAHSIQEALETGPAAGRPSVSRVAVETGDGVVRAEVGVLAGGQATNGSAEASSPVRAVATAALLAVGAAATVLDARESDVADARAMLVLVEAATGERAVAAEVVDGDALRAAASAALVAASRLNA